MLNLNFLTPKGTTLRRTTSYVALNAKIGPTGSSAGAQKNWKSAVNIRKFWTISDMCCKNPLADWSLNFFGSIYPRPNHVFQIWWRSVQGFRVGWGSNFAISHWLWR